MPGSQSQCFGFLLEIQHVLYVNLFLDTKVRCNDVACHPSDFVLNTDLECSERLGRSEAEGQRAKEACAINKSLSSLGDVFAALAAKSPHVPYRNCKLTHLLQVMPIYWCLHLLIPLAMGSGVDGAARYGSHPVALEKDGFALFLSIVLQGNYLLLVAFLEVRLLEL